MLYFTVNVRRLPFLCHFCKLCSNCLCQLSIFSDNVKALYRRAKANCEVWKIDEARQDFQRVTELDPSMTNKVKAEIRHLDSAIRKKDMDDKEKLMGKLFS